MVTRVAIACARIAHALFFLLTAAYCLLTYSPFAYQQFIRPHLVAGLVPMVVWHHLAFWVVLAITTVTMLPDLRRWNGRVAGWSYLLLSAVVGIALLVRPVLPQVENNGRGLLLAFAALAFPIWLAVFDHRATPEIAATDASSERRILAAALLAAVVVWLGQTLSVPFRLEYTGEITLAAAGVALGIVTSAVVHLLVFTVAALLLIVVLRASRLGGEYAALVAATAVGATLVIKRFAFGAISFGGLPAWLLAAELGLMLALLWSSVARRLASTHHRSALDIWRAPLPGARTPAAASAVLAALGVVAFVVFARVMTFDWDFVVQKFCVLVLWMAAFGYAYGAVRGEPGRVRARSLAAPPAAAVVLFGATLVTQPRLPQWLGDPGLVPEFVLQGYVAVDPSFRLIQDLLHVPSRENAEFYGFLRRHANITDDVKPVPLHFAKPLQAAGSSQPNIFVIVIDSLRRDYLSPYNDAAHFTPEIAAFARDSIVFDRAFSRYGGTGLSMPAMWTGGMVLHKQYITPYYPMSTLAQLLDAERYVKVLSPDHITVQMLAADDAYVELDRGRPEMEYRACRMLEEIGEVISRPNLSGPVFAHTRTLDLHIAHVRRNKVPAGRSYDGFVAPVAAAVEAIDTCFGAFVRTLRERGAYDHSIIVLTADHGDTLGERLSWGHALTLYPEVLRIPLIIHVPDELRRRYEVDPARIATLADLTPTLYQLTGHPPKDLGPLFGRPLLAPNSDAEGHPTDEPVLVGSSYGAVYGVLRANGEKLYIADGINEREYAYDLSGPTPVRLGITAEARVRDREFIDQQLRALARLYHYEPQS